MIHGNTTYYRIQDLLEYAREVKKEVPLYLCIMIKAAMVPMGDKVRPFTNARKLINNYGEIRLNDDALKLPILKLINNNKLINNFTEERYLIEGHIEEYMNGNKSDRDRIQGLIGSDDINAAISDSERNIMNEVKAFFDGIAVRYVAGVFNLPNTYERYSETDIRDEIVKGGSINANYDLFSPIIYNVCQYSYDTLSSAVEFAVQLNDGLNNSPCKPKVTPDEKEIRQFVEQGTVTDGKGVLREYYATVIRPNIFRNNDNIDNTKAKEIFDDLMGYEYKIEELLDFVGEVKKDAHSYLCIMIKAARVPFNIARNLIKHSGDGDIDLDKNDLKSSIIKLIHNNNLINNFTDESDRGRVQGLIGSIDANDRISDNERETIETIKAYFRKFVPKSDAPNGIFDLEYSTKDIRENIEKQLNRSISDNFALFLHSIHKVCHHWYYGLQKAVDFALPFIDGLKETGVKKEECLARLIQISIQRNKDDIEALQMLLGEIMVSDNKIATITAPIPSAVKVAWDGWDYRIQDLIDYSESINIKRCLYFYIMIKATGIRYSQARTVIDNVALFEYKQEELRSAVMKFVVNNRLTIDNFTEQPYKMSSKNADLLLGLDNLTGIMSDRDRITGLTTNMRTQNTTLSSQDKIIIERIKGYFIQSVNVDFSKIFDISGDQPEE